MNGIFLRTAFFTLQIITAGFIVSCSPGMFLGRPEASGPEVIQVRNSGSFDLELDTGGTTKDVFFVFTNPSSTTIIPEPPAIAEYVVVDGINLGMVKGQDLFSMEFPDHSPSLGTPENLSTLRKTAVQSVSGVQNSSSTSLAVVGDKKMLIGYYDYSGPREHEVAATCRKVVGPVQTSFGERTLNIWVQDSEWDPNPAGTKITQAKVDKLADRFLKSGPDNDIYDWVTGVLDAEWGPHTSPLHIAPANTVDILLENLPNSENGVIAGYFAPIDTIRGVSSNEKVMFFLNAALYAPAEGPSWDETDSGPNQTISTLVHEFQHLVQSYQKQVRNNITFQTDIWINEMCSLVMEDIVSYRLGITGPRGVSASDPSAGPSRNIDGRLPVFNVYTYGPLVDAYQSFQPYSVAYSFGAWLTRNYGGASLLRAIVQSSDTGPESITNAVKAAGGPGTLEKLVTQWAVAVIASDRTDMPAGYRFNTGGWFESTIDGTVYRLGSIDLYRYSYANDDGNIVLDGPGFLTSEGLREVGGFGAVSNLYYLAAQNQSGRRTYKVTVPDGVLMTVYMKPVP